MKILREAPWLDQENDVWDYGTSELNGDTEIFDKTKAEAPYYRDILAGSEHYKTYENKVGKVVYMTPEEYYQKCADEIFKGRGVTVDSLKRHRAYDNYQLDDIKKVLNKYNRKLAIPILDYTGPGQEGLHRMMVAGELVGWDVKQPVLVIDWYDKERHKKAEEKKRYHDIYYKIEKAVDKALHYHYSNIDEFKDELEYTLPNVFYRDEVEFEFSSNEDSFTVTVDGVEYSDDISKIKIDEDTENDIELDDVDLDDLDIDISEIGNMTATELLDYINKGNK